jgi:hypothetical protein
MNFLEAVIAEDGTYLGKIAGIISNQFLVNMERIWILILLKKYLE